MDIDIDLKSNFDPKKVFEQITLASLVDHHGKLVKHNTGVHFQNIPTDLLNPNISAIPNNDTDQYGYFKIDMLHNSALDAFESKEQMNRLLDKEPDWNLLKNREHVKKLFHIGNYYDLIQAINPQSTIEIADTIAFIRPFKDKLLDKYLKNKKSMRKELYTKRERGDMRKSHALAYALVVVLQLHLIEQGKL